MALHAVNPLRNQPEDERRQEDVPPIKACPICAGDMEVVYSRHGQQVVVCTECHSGLTVPASAWNIARVKRAAQRKPNTPP
jgi:ssDNA-binding Zn-finger/Zn-ribbon topoisomerase 1